VFGWTFIFRINGIGKKPAILRQNYPDLPIVSPCRPIALNRKEWKERSQYLADFLTNPWLDDCKEDPAGQILGLGICYSLAIFLQAVRGLNVRKEYRAQAPANFTLKRNTCRSGFARTVSGLPRIYKQKHCLLFAQWWWSRYVQKWFEYWLAAWGGENNNFQANCSTRDPIRTMQAILLFLQHQAQCLLQQNKYGISEKPTFSTDKIVEFTRHRWSLSPALWLLIKHGNRSVYGGGYYDSDPSGPWKIYPVAPRYWPSPRLPTKAKSDWPYNLGNPLKPKHHYSQSNFYVFKILPHWWLQRYCLLYLKLIKSHSYA